MVQELRVHCSCQYKCNRSIDGYQMVPKTTRKRHALKDRNGERYRFSRDAGTARTEGEELLIPDVNSRLSKCTCNVCGEEGKLIPRATKLRHMSINAWTRRSQVQEGTMDANRGDDIVPVPELYGSHTEDPEFPYSFLGDDENINVYTEARAPDLNEDAAQEVEEDEELGKDYTLDDAILETMIELFSVLDHHKVPIACQKKVLKIMYRGINKQEASTNSSSNKPMNYRGLCLARLFTLAGPDWKGGENGIAAPRTWNRLMETYRMSGMIDPDKWLMCTGPLGARHAPAVFQLTDEFNACPIEDCGIKKSKMCIFSYLPLEKILRPFFQSETFCHELLHMWRNRSHWLKDEGIECIREPDYINEFWDGTKVQEYSDFWNPNATWQLPIICPNLDCKKAYRLWPSPCEELENEDNFNAKTGCYFFPCVNCSEEINQKSSTTTGCPFNIALMGHWDGFQAATTVQKDCWTVEVVVLNGGKKPMPNSKLGKPIPILFIPMSSKLLQKEKQDYLLQSFLKPLYKDLQEIFVSGFLVKPNYPTSYSLVPFHRNQTITVRVIMMVWTGDGPAQAKIGGTLLMGYNGCRRDFVHSEKIGATTATGKKYSKVVYSENRRQARIPSEKRNIEEMHLYGKCLQEAVNEKERLKYKEESGLSHFSKMWLLYDLYGFNVSLDLVNDPMHSLALGVLKSFNDRLLLSCDISEVKMLMKILQQVTSSRPVGLGARWPRPPLYVKNASGVGSKWKFSNYKAEEHLLFTMYCLAPILEELGYTLLTPLGAEGAILIHLCRLFFLVSRKKGWTKDMLRNARLHSSAWRVITEEAYGPNGRIIEHVIGSGEILDDIERHGHHDLFWCYGFERMVSSYNNISTNRKSSELSFADYFCRQQFSDSFIQLQQEKDGLQQDHRTLSMLQHALYPRIVGLPVRVSPCAMFYTQKICMVTSIEKAIQLWTLVDYMGKPDLPSIQAAMKGIGIGPNEGLELETPLDGDICFYLKSYWEHIDLPTDPNYHLFRNRIEMVRGVVVHGLHYRVNDLVVAKSPNKEMPSVKCRILSFFSHAFDSHHQLFFKACRFTQVQGEGEDATGMAFLENEPSEICIFPVHDLLHKFFPHPTRVQANGKKAIVAFELQDITLRTHLLVPGKPGCCPPWPIREDIVIISLPTSSYSSLALYLAYVTAVDYDNAQNSEKELEVSWLVRDSSSETRITGHEIFRAKDVNLVYTLRWNAVLTVVDNSLFQKIELGGCSILQWKVPENWESRLFLKQDQIQPPPQYASPHDQFQFLQ